MDKSEARKPTPVSRGVMDELKYHLNWDTKAVTIIKEQIAARKKLGIKNDTKLEFLQSKLDAKCRAIVRLTSYLPK